MLFLLKKEDKTVAACFLHSPDDRYDKGKFRSANAPSTELPVIPDKLTD